MKKTMMAALAAMFVLGGVSAVQAADTETVTEAELQEIAKMDVESAEPKLFPWLRVEDHRRALRMNGRVIAWTSYPEIVVIGDDYPVLQHALRDWSDEQKRRSEDETENMENAVRAFVPSEPFYDSVVVDRWGRVDEQVVSFALSSGTYDGGAHPQHGITGVTLSTETGEPVSIDTIITGREVLLLTLADAFRKQYPGREQDLFSHDIDETLNDYHDGGDWQKYIDWMIDANNDLHVFYNPYDIAPYSAGGFELTLPRDVYPEVYRRDLTE